MKNSYLSILAALICSLVFTSCLKEDPNPSLGKPNPMAPLALVRDLYKGQDLKLEPQNVQGAVRISGVVVSEFSGNNLSKSNLLIQNTSKVGTRGITLNLGEAAAQAYAFGDSLVIELSGATLSKVNGNLQINGLTPANILKAAEGIAVAPKAVAIGELTSNFSNYEGTLVQVNADVTPLPEAGETYSGSTTLDDGSGNTITLYTEPTAAFAANRVPASATFIGIPVWAAGEAKQLRMRSINDVENASGPIYAGFPEDFESPPAATKASYNMAAIDNNIQLKTGNWKLFQAILGDTPNRDRFNPPGKQAVRMQQGLSVSGLVQMNFDLPDGASKVTVWYGSYFTDASSTWRLEYSTNGGQTWTQTGSDISDASPEHKVATFMMDIKGPVRFRVNKLGLGATRNGRLSIEDIAVYKGM